MDSNFSTVIRLRDDLEDTQIIKTSENKQIIVDFSNIEKQLIPVTLSTFEGQIYEQQFDQVFLKENNQEIFDKKFKKNVKEFLGMKNQALITYGEVSSGKTYSLYGSKGHDSPQNTKGIIQCVLDQIFEEKSKHSSDQEKIYLGISFVEISQEKVFDLLQVNEDQNPKQISIRQINEYFQTDSLVIKLNCVEHAQEVIDKAFQSKNSAGFKDNQQTQKTHTLLNLFLEKVILDKEKEKNVNQIAKWTFIDLASSERLEKNCQKELVLGTKNVNQSLFYFKCFLEDFIRKQNETLKYRNSTLTKLLKEIFFQEIRLDFLVCISPSFLSLEKSFQSLQFAELTKQLRRKNNQTQFQNTIKNLLQQTQQKDQQIEKLEKELKFLGKYLQGILNNIFLDNKDHIQFRDDLYFDQKLKKNQISYFPQQKQIFQREVLIDEIIQSKTKEVEKLKQSLSQEISEKKQFGLLIQNLLIVLKMLLNEDVSLFYQLDTRSQEFLILNALWMAQNLKVISFNKDSGIKIPHQINHYISLQDIYKQLFGMDFIINQQPLLASQLIQIIQNNKNKNQFK